MLTSRVAAAPAAQRRTVEASATADRAPAVGPDAVDVWIFALDDTAQDDDLVAGTLSASESARARRFRFAADRRRFARCHATVRAILGACLDVDPCAVAILADDAGKPRLDPARHPAPLHFNLAHSHELAVLAVGPSAIGIDLERERPLREADALVMRYFAPDERAVYAALPAATRPRAFFAAWTLKEAYLKAVGEGLGGRLDAFSVTMHPDEPPRLLSVPEHPDETARWRLLRLAVHPGYVGALAAAADVTRVHQHTWGEPLR